MDITNSNYLEDKVNKNFNEEFRDYLNVIDNINFLIIHDTRRNINVTLGIRADYA